MVAMLKSELEENSSSHDEALLQSEANVYGLRSQIEWYKIRFEEWKTDDGGSPSVSAAVPPPPGLGNKPPDMFDVHTPARRARTPSPVGSNGNSVIGMVKEKTRLKLSCLGFPV